jgi:hypothetical protein
MAGSLRATERAHEGGTTTLDRVRHEALEKKRKREEAAFKAASKPRSALGSSEFVAASDRTTHPMNPSRYAHCSVGKTVLHHW